MNATEYDGLITEEAPIPSYTTIDGLPQTRLRMLTREHAEAAATVKLAEEKKKAVAEEILAIVTALNAPKSIDVEGYRVTRVEGAPRHSLNVDKLVLNGVSKATILKCTDTKAGKDYVTITAPKRPALL
jgi:hypothetical protein